MEIHRASSGTIEDARLTASGTQEDERHTASGTLEDERDTASCILEDVSHNMKRVDHNDQMTQYYNLCSMF